MTHVKSFSLSFRLSASFTLHHLYLSLFSLPYCCGFSVWMNFFSIYFSSSHTKIALHSHNLNGWESLNENFYSQIYSCWVFLSLHFTLNFHPLSFTRSSIVHVLIANVINFYQLSVKNVPNISKALCEKRPQQRVYCYNGEVVVERESERVGWLYALISNEKNPFVVWRVWLKAMLMILRDYMEYIRDDKSSVTMAC